MRIVLSIVLLLCFVGCSTYKKVTFKSDTFMSAGKEYRFKISIPRGYVKKGSDTEQYLLWEYRYKGSEVLYLSLDINYNNSPNKQNWLKCSHPLDGFKCKEGVQDDGRYWKEILKHNLVIGYYNVDSCRKSVFDDAILTLELVEKNK